jgi:hypothetical protein
VISPSAPTPTIGMEHAYLSISRIPCRCNDWQAATIKPNRPVRGLLGLIGCGGSTGRGRCGGVAGPVTRWVDRRRDGWHRNRRRVSLRALRPPRRSKNKPPPCDRMVTRAGRYPSRSGAPAYPPPRTGRRLGSLLARGKAPPPPRLLLCGPPPFALRQVPCGERLQVWYPGKPGLSVGRYGLRRDNHVEQSRSI